VAPARFFRNARSQLDKELGKTLEDNKIPENNTLCDNLTQSAFHPASTFSLPNGIP
jgi:hypothetical protein